MGEAIQVRAMRAAETTIRASGGFPVLLRLPGLAASGNDGEQLGLSTPAFQDEPVGPAVWRKVGIDTALVLGAGAIVALMGTQGFDSAESLFESAAGVVVDGVFYTITDCQAIVSGGVPCGYRLNLTGPAWS